jgi:hypothetical protein
LIKTKYMYYGHRWCHQAFVEDSVVSTLVMDVSNHVIAHIQNFDKSNLSRLHCYHSSWSSLLHRRWYEFQFITHQSFHHLPWHSFYRQPCLTPTNVPHRLLSRDISETNFGKERYCMYLHQLSSRLPHKSMLACPHISIYWWGIRNIHHTSHRGCIARLAR